MRTLRGDTRQLVASRRAGVIVEDEPYMAEAIRDGLRLEAIAADIAGDGDAALELLSFNAYDIAVLDRDIPGPTGDEIAERIVASGSGRTWRDGSCRPRRAIDTDMSRELGVPKKHSGVGCERQPRTGWKRARRTSSAIPCPRLWPRAGAREQPSSSSARRRRSWRGTHSRPKRRRRSDD